MDGLGTAGYISTLDLTSTSKGLESYISTSIAGGIPNTTGTVLYLNYTTIVYDDVRELSLSNSINQTASLTTPVPANSYLSNIVAFVTDFGLPPFIPGGIWDLNLFAASSNQVVSLFAELYVKNATETLIATTSNASDKITNSTENIGQYLLSFNVPYTLISTGSAILLRINASNDSPTTDDIVYTYFEGYTYSHMHTTFGTILPAESLTSTVAGLGTAGYISTAQFIDLSNYYAPLLSLDISSGLSTVAEFTSNSSNYFVNGLQDYSTFISSVAEFTSNTSNYFLQAASFDISTALISTVDGLAEAGYISSFDLTSTVDGLAQAGYISSLDLQSTVFAYSLIVNTSSVFASTGIFSSIQVDSLFIGTGLGTISFPDIYALSLTTPDIEASNINVSTINGFTVFGPVISTVEGLGSAGYVSSFDLASTLDGFGTAGYISTAQLFSTLDGLGSAGYISTLDLVSTLDGLGSAGYISTAQLFSTLDGLGTAGYISTLDLTSTLDGLGTAGYISSQQLISTLDGLGSAGYISSLDLLSTLDGLGTAGYISSQQLISTVESLGNSVYLTSTVDGLGTAGYVSSFDLLSTLDGLGTAGYISSLQLISTLDGLGSAGYVSSFDLLSTLDGLGTAGYISSLQLISTLDGLGSAGYVSSFDLLSTLDGLGTAGYISSLQLISTLDGLGSAGYVSSFDLLSTLDGLGTAGYISSLQLISTVDGLGTAGYISTLDLVSTVDGLGTAGYISSLQLTSTSRGLEYFVSTSIAGGIPNTTGTVLYLNYGTIVTGSYRELSLSNSINQAFILSTTVSKNTSVTQFVTFMTDFDLPPFIPGGIWDLNLFAASSNQVASLYGELYVKTDTETLIATSCNAANLITNTITDIGQYIFTFNVPYTLLSRGSAVLLKLSASNPSKKNDVIYTYYEGNTYSHIHTTFGTILPAYSLTSTVTGLGTAGYISSAQFADLSNYFLPLLSLDVSSGISTVAEFTSNSSNYLMNSFQDYSTFISTVAEFTSNTSNYFLPQLGLDISTSLVSTVDGLGTAGYISSAQLISTVTGLGNGGYSGDQFTSTVDGLGQAGYISSLDLLSTLDGLGTAGYLSTFDLFSTLDGLATAGYISSAQLISTVEGLGNGGNSELQFTSTVDGLGQAGYISSSQLQSTFSGISITGVTVANLTSTTAGLGNTQYASTSLVLISAPSQYIPFPPIKVPSILIQDWSTAVSTVARFTSNTTVSTTLGLGSAGYASTKLVFLNTPVPTLPFPNIYGGVVIRGSTITTNQTIQQTDNGTYFFYTTTTAGLQIQIPTPAQAGNGWNITIQNQAASSQNIQVNSTPPKTLAPGTTTRFLSDGISMYFI